MWHIWPIGWLAPFERVTCTGQDKQRQVARGYVAGVCGGVPQAIEVTTNVVITVHRVARGRTLV